MHHARHFNVGAKILLGENFRRDVLPFDRLPDDRVRLRVFRLRLARSVERIAVFAVPVEMHVEVTATDEIGIADLFCGLVRSMHDAVRDRQLLGRRGELVGRHRDQNAPRFGGGHAHLLAAFLKAGRTGSSALVHAGRGIAHEDFHAIERHVELFGHDLPDGDEQTLAHIHLAEEGRDRAVGIHRNVARELIRRERRFHARAHGRCVLGISEIKRHRRADRNDKCASGLEKAATREIRCFFHPGHGALLNPSSRRRV